MSVERSHGKARITRPRLRAVTSGATASARRERDHAADGKFRHGNRAAADHAVRAAVARREYAALRTELDKAAGGLVEASESAVLLRDTLALYRATRRSLASGEPVVLSSALAFARESCLASLLMSEALRVGVTTDRGLQLIEASQRAEARAERASLHALVLAERLSEADARQRSGANAIHAAILDAPLEQEGSEP